MNTINMSNMNVIGYVRTAVKDPTGDQLIKQAKEIELYCSQNKLHLLEIFKDNGVSGLDFNREGWNELRDYLQNNKGTIDSLVVPDYARISRNSVNGPKQIEELRREFGIEILSVSILPSLEKTAEILMGKSPQPQKKIRGMRK